MEKVSNKAVAAADDARSKKARARPALTLVNLFSSAGRRPQPTAVSSRHVPVPGGRSDRDGNTPGLGTRRSARLMGNGNKHPIPNKVEFPVCHPTSRGFLAYALSHVFYSLPRSERNADLAHEQDRSQQTLMANLCAVETQRFRNHLSQQRNHHGQTHHRHRAIGRHHKNKQHRRHTRSNLQTNTFTT